MAFDSALRQFGRMDYEGLQFEIDAGLDMSAVCVEINDHKVAKYSRFQGACADFDMTDWSEDDSVFMVLFVLANGDDIPAGQLTMLADWGLYNDGSTAGRTLAAGDILSFIGHNGMAVGCGHEVRTTSGTHRTMSLLHNNVIGQ
jgi:hypothetical protein